MFCFPLRKTRINFLYFLLIILKIILTMRGSSRADGRNSRWEIFSEGISDVFHDDIRNICLNFLLLREWITPVCEAHVTKHHQMFPGPGCKDPEGTRDMADDLSVDYRWFLSEFTHWLRLCGVARLMSKLTRSRLHWRWAGAYLAARSSPNHPSPLCQPVHVFQTEVFSSRWLCGS